MNNTNEMYEILVDYLDEKKHSIRRLYVSSSAKEP